MPDPITGLLAAGSTYFASRQAKKGTEAATSAAQKGIDTELEMYYKSREDLAPWRAAGEKALTSLERKIQAGPGEFRPEEEPGYRFGYKEFVEKPLQRAASAGGRLGSGRTLSELSRYASDYATTKYDNFLDRWLRSLAPEQSLAGVGLTTAGQQAQNALTTGANIAGLQSNIGDIRRSGYETQGQLWGNFGTGMAQNALDEYYMKKYPPITI